MKKEIKKKQIADYMWLGKTQRSWHLWAGNPFSVSLYRVPLREKTEEQIIKIAKEMNDKERKRFAKEFPDIEWKLL